MQQIIIPVKIYGQMYLCWHRTTNTLINEGPWHIQQIRLSLFLDSKKKRDEVVNPDKLAMWAGMALGGSCCPGPIAAHYSRAKQCSVQRAPLTNEEDGKWLVWKSNKEWTPMEVTHFQKWAWFPSLKAFVASVKEVSIWLAAENLSVVMLQRPRILSLLRRLILISELNSRLDSYPNTWEKFAMEKKKSLKRQLDLWCIIRNLINSQWSKGTLEEIG